MHLYALCQWLQSTSWATGIRESLDLYPALYTLHIFGFVIMVTATSVLDLRILCLGLRTRSVASVAQLALPWAQAGLAANLITGFLIFRRKQWICIRTRHFAGKWRWCCSLG